MCWNKLSLASSHLNDVRFGTGEGHLRVCVARFVGPLQILVVGLSIKENNWLTFGAATSSSSFCVIL